MIYTSYFSEANKYYNSKDYKKAITYYRKSIADNENEACSYYNAGVCFIKLKDFNNAVPMLKVAISYQKDSKYFFNLGYCYAMMNQNKKALISFNLAWAINNTDDDCRKAMNLIMKRAVAES